MARPLQILLLSGLDETLSVERATLRQLGARVRGLRSGRSALEYLAGNANRAAEEKPDLLVCTETLSDMGARDFLRALRLLAAKTGLPQPPVLVVCGGRPEAFTELGAAATVTRPYTARTMSEALVAAQSAPGSLLEGGAVAGPAQLVGAAFGATPGLAGGRAADMFFVKRQRAAGEKLAERNEQAGQTGQNGLAGLAEEMRSSAAYRSVARALPGHSPAAGESLPETLPGNQSGKLNGKLSDNAANAAENNAKDNPLLYTRNGLRALRAGRLTEARSLLRAALKADGLDLEACLGLAGVYRRQGDEAAERRWLNRAAIICLESGQKARARGLQERLPREMAENPHLTEARNLLLEANYPEAAEAFLKLSLRKGQPPLHQLLARAAQLTTYPEEALHNLCEAFSRNGQPGLAASLYQRLLEEEGQAERLDFEPQSFWTRFPRLYEVMAVARFTLHAWRTNP